MRQPPPPSLSPRRADSALAGAVQKALSSAISPAASEHAARLFPGEQRRQLLPSCRASLPPPASGSPPGWGGAEDPPPFLGEHRAPALVAEVPFLGSSEQQKGGGSAALHGRIRPSRASRGSPSSCGTRGHGLGWDSLVPAPRTDPGAAPLGGLCQAPVAPRAPCPVSPRRSGFWGPSGDSAPLPVCWVCVCVWGGCCPLPTPPPFPAVRPGRCQPAPSSPRGWGHRREQ